MRGSPKRNALREALQVMHAVRGNVVDGSEPPAAPHPDPIRLAVYSP